MKGFLVFLVLVGLLVGSYFYVPQVRQAVDAQLKLTSRAVRGGESAGTLEGTAADAAETSRTPGSDATETVRTGSAATGATADRGAAPNTAQPATDGTAQPPSPPANRAAATAEPAPEDKYAAAYPLPEFKPLEEIVGNWKKIPPSAFPREIVILEPVEMVIAGGAGRSSLPAGSKIMALGIEGSTLTIAPHPGASARSRIDIDQTTLKEVLGEVYENFKKRKTQAVLAQRDRARRADRQEELAAIAAQDAKRQLLGPKPEQAADGKVPVMVASINNKDVTEFHIGMVEGWGPVGYDEIEGEPYWIGTVRYDAETIFGTFPAEAMALMRQNKVVKWVYSGSLEPVP